MPARFDFDDDLKSVHIEGQGSFHPHSDGKTWFPIRVEPSRLLSGTVRTVREPPRNYNANLSFRKLKYSLIGLDAWSKIAQEHGLPAEYHELQRRFRLASEILGFRFEGKAFDIGLRIPLKLSPLGLSGSEAPSWRVDFVVCEKFRRNSIVLRVEDLCGFGLVIAQEDRTCFFEGRDAEQKQPGGFGLTRDALVGDSVDFARTAPREHLIIPSMPTPNGRLHLGHIAGPFLRADVLARHLTRRGDQVHVISGCDSYESYMERQATRENRNASLIAQENTKGILADLIAMDMKPDNWIDPLRPNVKEFFSNTHLELMNAVVPKAKRLAMDYPVVELPGGREVLFGWKLKGGCPRCSQAAGGSSCENCGAHFQPWELRDPRSTHDENAVVVSRTWIDDEPFLVIQDDPKILHWLDRARLAPKVRDRARRAISGTPHHVRLVAPTDWGIPAPGSTPQTSLYTYSFNLAYCLYIGNVFQLQMDPNKLHPFSEESNVQITATFGLDVMMTKLLNVPALCFAHGGYRPFDRAIVNPFYLLQGEKFSTSRGHAIWVDAWVKQGLSTDATRFYMATISQPDFDQRSNFDTDEFTRIWNELADQLNGLLAACSQAITELSTDAPEQSLVKQFQRSLQEQERALDEEPLDLARVANSITSWMNVDFRDARTSARAYWWLKALALLTYPLMPSFGKHLWQRLGHRNSPRLGDWLARPGVLLPIQAGELQLPRIDPSQLQGLLPKT